MESPVIVEKCANFAMPVDRDESGFPFDDDYSFEDRLNNIAQRHPQFADQLRFDDFPSLRRKRNGSGSSDQDNLRFGVGPSRFGGFNSRFPFGSHFEDEFASEPAQNRQEKPPEVPKSQEKRGRKPNPNLPQHLSNTVDLGQKQPPVEEVRSQRSMSAPPENRSTQSSRVEHEIPEDQDMGKSQSRPSEPAPSHAKERIIPIHVEGRSEPVIPKNYHTHTHHANSGPQAQPEQVFGQEKFYVPPPTSAHFAKANDPHATKRQQAYDQFRPGPGSGFAKQSTPPHQQHYQQPQQQQQHQHHQQQQHQQPQPQPQQFQQAGPQPQQYKQTTPPPDNRPNQQQRATPPPSNDPLDKIKIVKKDVLDLMTNVQNFQGTRKDKEYIYLDEMLTRNLIKLDDISTDGKDNIRSARKEAIKCIQTCINNLEAKAQARERELKAAEEQQTNTATEGGANQTQSEAQNQNSAQEQQTLCPPTFKSEATINLSGENEEQPSGQEQQQQQQQMEVEQKQENLEKSTDAAATQNNGAAAAVTPMDIDTNEQQPESVQSNSSQPETTSK